MDIITSTLDRIKPVESELLHQAQARLDNKTKPPGSLGRIEEFARRMSAISGNKTPDTTKKVIFTFAGDHGVQKVGVSLNPDCPVERVLPLLADVDLVLVMSVYAGFGGQRFMPEMLAKTRAIRARG